MSASVKATAGRAARHHASSTTSRIETARPRGCPFGRERVHVDARARSPCQGRRMRSLTSAMVAVSGRATNSEVMMPPAVFLRIAQQLADGLLLLDAHQVEELLGLLVGQLADDVGCVVGVHLGDHAGGLAARAGRRSRRPGTRRPARSWPRRRWQCRAGGTPASAARGSSCSMMSAMSAGCMSSSDLWVTESLTCEMSRSSRSM